MDSNSNEAELQLEYKTTLFELCESEMNQRLKCGEIFIDNEKISMDCLICNLTIRDDNFVKHIEGHLIGLSSVNKTNRIAPKSPQADLKNENQQKPEKLERIFLTNEYQIELKDVIFHCPVKNCEYTTETRKELSSHIYQNHELIQLRGSYFECSMCEAKYSKRDTVNRHIKLKHNLHTKLELNFMGAGQYNCSECPKVYLRLLDYNMHLKRSHEKYFNTLLADQQEQFELSVNWLDVSENNLNENTDQELKCLIRTCPISSKSKKDLYVHILETHYLTLNIGDYYQCAICDVKYNTRNPLVGHLKRDHGIILNLKFNIENNIFKCPQCDKDFKTNLMLNYHLKKKHLNYFNQTLAMEILKLQKLMSSKDKTSINGNENTIEYSELIKQLENSQLPSDFFVEDLESWELDNEEKSEELVFENNIVSKQEIKVAEHIENNEDNKNKVKANGSPQPTESTENLSCLLKNCLYSSISKKELYIHILTRHNLTFNVGNHYQCGICDNIYNQRTSLIRHLNRYHGILLNLKLKIENDVFKCPQCNDDFKTSIILNSHLKKNHSNYFNETLATEIVKLQDSRKKENENSKNLKHKNHVSKLELHRLQKLIVQLDNGLWKCLHCNETKDKRNNMRVHVRNHFDRKMCEICGKLTKTKKHILHMRTHTGEKPHKCEYCEKRFANYTNFRNHVRTHTGDKRHKCDYCDQRFIQRTSKMTHMRVIHLKIQPYQCDICGKNFSTLGQLRTHVLRSHTHEARFECEICHRKFIANYMLNHHKLLHSNPAPYECDICGCKYALKNSLRMHKNTKHAPK